MARIILWLKSLICFLCSSISFFRFCSNIHSIAFRVTWFALSSCWLSFSWPKTLSKEDSCWSSGDSSNISRCQLRHVISPHLHVPWMKHGGYNNVELEALVTSTFRIHKKCNHTFTKYLKTNLRVQLSITIRASHSHTHTQTWYKHILCQGIPQTLTHIALTQTTFFFKH